MTGVIGAAGGVMGKIDPFTKSRKKFLQHDSIYCCFCQTRKKAIWYNKVMKKIFSIILVVIGTLAMTTFLFNSFKKNSFPDQASQSTSTSQGSENTAQIINALKVPEGFAMSVFASSITGARVMTFDPQGVMLVSETSEGRIVALPDKDGNGEADSIITVASDLNKPHGMAFRCSDPEHPFVCKLYVGETDKLSVFDYDAATLKAANKMKLLDLPSDGPTAHETRTLLFMPSPNENTLLISIGSSCNTCVEDDPMRAKIIAYDVATKKTEEFASGLRNAVFMEPHPVTGAIFATENERDGLGPNIPPDEINIIEKGKNYGWPICYGKNIHDDKFDKKTYIRDPCSSPIVPSYIDLQAHSAALGLAFVPEEGWPEEYWYNLFVAYHGSWDREIPTGYKIVRIKLDSHGKLAPGSDIADFITGWLKSDGTVMGRPVDIKILSGGVMYISDDKAGFIYKVVKK